MVCKKRGMTREWLFMVCAILWGVLAIMDVVHGNGWSEFAIHLLCCLVWGLLAYRSCKEID